MRNLPRLILAKAVACGLAAPARAADHVGIGFVTTLCGPSGVIGKHMRDAANGMAGERLLIGLSEWLLRREPPARQILAPRAHRERHPTVPLDQCAHRGSAPQGEGQVQHCHPHPSIGTEPAKG